MKAHLRLLLPFVVFVALLAVACVTVVRASRSFTRTPPPVANIDTIPRKPRAVLGALPDPSECLATSPNFAGLRACSTQSDCASCAESPTSCIVVGGDAEVDGKLVYPVSVHVPVENTVDDCSGHGTRALDDRQCVCDGVWNADGSCASEVCYTGKNCEVGVFSVTQAGRYCLPSYLGACNEFTSDTVLTNVGAGTTWSCQCKPTMAGLFIQEVEGGSCDRQVACGAPVGVSATVNVGSSTAPVFAQDIVYPNRLTSYTSGQEVCVYQTSGASMPNAPVPGVGPNQAPAVTPLVTGPALDSDPTCVPRRYSNKCTINTGGGNQQVVRGSGLPGDPHVTRVSPPFYAPVPPGLNRCPDGWTGEGTLANPCTSPITQQRYAFFTPSGEWLGPTITSVAELQKWWVNVSNLDARERIWTTLSAGDVFCLESGTDQSSFATAGNAKSAFCLDEACSAAEGRRALSWNGTRDGPLLNEDALPHWLSGGPYGGQCTCDGHIGNLRTVPSHLLSETEWWTCGPDMCAGSKFSGASFNQETQRCDCPTADTPTPPFNTGMHYKALNAPAVCVADPCNPSGVNARVNTVECSTDAQCQGLCSEQQCYIPFGDGQSCSTDLECTSRLSGMSNRATKCVNGTCATLDLARARMGSTCTADAHCSLGACTGTPGAVKTCTGGCACAAGYHQMSDGGASSLGFTCVDDCVGKCLNGGTCVHDADGGTTCRCTPFFGGARCETKLCSRIFEYCDAYTPCCSECPCTENTTNCCNRFPREVDADVVCENNMCTVKSVGRLPTKCQEWYKNDNGLISFIPDTCAASPPYPSYPGQMNAWYTDAPPDCNGWGVRGGDNKCTCLPSRTGENCETEVCALEFQACQANTDCCNNCVCTDGNSRVECCAPTRDVYTPFTHCINSTCQRISY